ncbi:MAG: hypothetical protein PWP24_308 [Clostridiales bacterium]|nr:hypothetical protein [Clostridiales bacterium]
MYLNKWYLVKKKKSNILCFVFALFILLFLQASTVNAASIKIRYNGKTYDYTSVQANATLDGTSIATKGTPGILINDTCMQSASDVFKKGLGVTYQYDSKTKAIHIQKNDITIDMTLNSKVAYINGVKVTCDVAPLKIKFIAAKKTKVFLPARFVAEALGYTYTWNKTAQTSEMKSPFVINYDGSWRVYKDVQGAVNFDGTLVSLQDTPSIVLDKTTLVPANEVFSAVGAVYSYDETSKTITLTKNDTTIIMIVDNTTAYVNGVEQTLASAPRIVFTKTKKEGCVMVPVKFIASTFGYEYSWNATQKTSYIKSTETIYLSNEYTPTDSSFTSLCSIKASGYQSKDFLDFTANAAMDVSVYKVDETHIQIILNAMDDTSMSGFTEDLSSATYLKGITLTVGDGILIFDITKTSESSYYTVSSSTGFQLVLCEESNQAAQTNGFQLKIPIPAELSYNLISTEDQYYKNRFLITLPGDYATYFDQNPITFDDTVVSNVSVESILNTETLITVDTCGLKGYRLNNCNDFIGVNVASPSSIYDKIIVLDPGHGGKDNGTANKGTKEKDLNLTIIYELAKDYFNGKDSTIKAYWTRRDDTFITLEDRAAFASKVEADVFVSLHMNSATSKAKGLEVYYSKDNSSKKGNLTSSAMANLFFDQLITDLDTDVRSVKSAGFVVVKKNTVPSILIELGFLSNSSDYAKLTDPDYQDFAAHAIYNAAVRLFDEYPTGR